MMVVIMPLIRDATYLSNKQRSRRWHPAFAKQGIKRAIAVNSVSLEVWTILVSFSILYQSVPKGWSSPSRTLYMISLGVYPSVIRRRLTWPLSRHLALYSKKILDIVLFISQWRQKEFIDERTAVFSVIEKIHRLFRVILNACSNPIDFILFGGWSLKETTITTLYFAVLVSC